MIRRHMIISGDVQGVGFRYRAKYSAVYLGLTGYVRNLYDGRVELEVQGDRELISRFLMEVESVCFINIENIESKDIPVVEEERSFSVRHDG